MNKLLIVCDMFPPAFAPRMGYLCKYLKRMGWEISVVTESIPENTFAFLTGNANVTFVNYYKASGRTMRRIEWIGVMLLDFLFHYKDRKIIQEGSLFLKAGGYKAILCSTYRTFPLLAAKALAQRFHIPFIADLRDIVEEYASNEYITHTFHTLPCLDTWITRIFRNRLIKDRNKALKAASYVTTVSPWHVQVLKAYNPKVELIYNGFDPDLFYPEQIKTPKFTITYTGRLLSLAIRDPELLFVAIANLATDKMISPDTFQVVWYTDPASRSIIDKEAKRLGVDTFMNYHDYVPAHEIPHILNKSSILLSLTNKWDGTGPKGFMTTKFFESLAVEKPILCVRSDEAYLAQAIQETRSGLAATNAKEVYDFLLYYYKEWQEKGYTSSTTDRSKLSIYSRKDQAMQFVHLLEKL